MVCMSHSSLHWQAELQTCLEPSSPEDVSTEIASLKLVEVWFITEFVLKGSIKMKRKKCPSETCNILHFSKIGYWEDNSRPKPQTKKDFKIPRNKVLKLSFFTCKLKGLKEGKCCTFLILCFLNEFHKIHIFSIIRSQDLKWLFSRYANICADQQ